MFTFLNSSGQVAFVRDDAEQAEWTEHELCLRCDFPYDAGKPIARGMRILFQDPATSDWKAYEIRTCTFYAEENAVQVVAEDIAISELTDCHFGTKTEITDKTAGQALTTLLTGTGWSVGTNTASGTSSVDITRGSVWQGVSVIEKNWNVYIMPRVTVGASGITGKYLDILPSEGVWRGLRLSIDKNMTDPVVTYDDSELYTALYGYGATVSDNGTSNETTFASEVWTATSSHPAKPSGQKYIEDPAKTALYGRNGMPRFGYYQNSSIKSGSVLLQKTWDVLKTCCDPKISISGTALDLKRLGYVDEPLRLHDMVIVDVQPDGTLFYKQIIQLTVNLIDPSDNRLTIGDYIPNIIYINRETNNYATGGGVGVDGSTNAEMEITELEAENDNTDYDLDDLAEDVAQNTQDIATNTQDIATNTHDISVNAHDISVNAHDISVNAQNITAQGQTIDLHTQTLATDGSILSQAGLYLDGSGVLVYADSAANMLGSRFRVQADQIGMVVGTYQDGTNYIKAGEICLAINATTGQSTAKILADHVIMDSVSGTPIDVAINGKLNVTDLAAAIGDITQLRVQVVYGDSLNIDEINVSNNASIDQYGNGDFTSGTFGSIYINGSQGYWDNITIDGVTYRLLRASAAG